MASVLLTSLAPSDDADWPHPYDQLDRMRLSASQDAHQVHTLTDDPAAADVILFVENCSPLRHYMHVRQHPYYREFASKCFLYSRYDFPIPLLPGIYPSIEHRWHNRQWTRSGGYLVAFTNDFLEYDEGRTPRRFLFSFIGAAFNHPLRRTLLQLPDEAAYLRDTTPEWPYGDLPTEEQEALRARYREVALQSRFVVCPRGKGPSSIRLFETLRMGRAPVIISDAWVPPEGPDWPSFSLRIPEADLDRLPDLLADHASDAIAMGRRARTAWKDWFSVASTFHRSVESCLDMQASRRWPFAVLRLAAFGHFARPLHLRALARHLWTRRPSLTPAPA